MIRRLSRIYFHHSAMYYLTLSIAMTAGGIASYLLEITGRFVWEPAEAFVTMLLLLFFNAVTDLAMAKKERRSFKQQFMSSVKHAIACITLLFFAFNLGKHEPVLFWLPSVVMGPMALFEMITTLRDMVKLKWIDSEFASQLLKKLESKYPSMMDITPTAHDSSDSKHP